MARGWPPTRCGAVPRQLSRAPGRRAARLRFLRRSRTLTRTELEHRPVDVDGRILSTREVAVEEASERVACKVLQPRIHPQVVHLRLPGVERSERPAAFPVGDGRLADDRLIVCIEHDEA